MTEFFEDKGTWLGSPVTVQGIFENGELIACKVLDTDGKPISWSFTGRMAGTLESFKKAIQYLYNKSKGQ